MNFETAIARSRRPNFPVISSQAFDHVEAQYDAQAFELIHGFPIEEWRRRLDRIGDDEVDRITESMRGNIIGLSARSRLQSYLLWVAKEQAELDRLEALKARLATPVGSVAAHKGTKASVVERLSAKLVAWLAAGGDAPVPVVDPSDVDAVLDADRAVAAETLRSEAAKAAIADIESKIDVQRLRVITLTKRHREFLAAALEESAESIRTKNKRAKQLVESTTVELESLQNFLGDIGKSGIAYSKPSQAYQKWQKLAMEWGAA
jgi:hypothetical protein